MQEVQEPLYSDKVYEALKQKVSGFKLTKEEFNARMNDSAYQKKVYGALKEKVGGFKLNEEEFYERFKKKEYATNPSLAEYFLPSQERQDSENTSQNSSAGLPPEHAGNPPAEGTGVSAPFIYSPNDPFGIGETVVKQIYSGLGDQVPKAAAQAIEVGLSGIQSANMDEYIKNKKPVDFQRYVRSKDPNFVGDGGIIDKIKGGLTPFNIDEYLPIYKDRFIEENGLQDIQREIEARQEHIIQRRRGVEQYVQQQNKESQETLAGVPQSYKDIKSPGDAIRYATNLAAQGLWQIPLVIATKGTSGLAMEAAEVYDQQLDKIVETHNQRYPDDKIDRDEAIKRNLDKPAEGQLYALAAAGMDTFSAGGLLNIVKKGGSSLLKTTLAVASETLTEPTQGMLEEMGGAAGAGTSQVEAFKDAWTKNLSKRLDEAAGGFFGSGLATMVSPEQNIVAHSGDLGKQNASANSDSQSNSPTEEVTKEQPVKQQEDSIHNADKVVVDGEVENTKFDKNEQGADISQRSPQEEQRGGESLHSQIEEVKNRLAEGIGTAEAQFKRSLTRHEVEDSERQSSYQLAKEKGIWISDIHSLGTRLEGGNENTLIVNQDESIVYKANNLFNSGNSISQFLEQTENHNEVFPESSYTFVGFTGIEKSKGVPYIEPIVKQDYIPNAEQASQADIDGLMFSKGFEKVNNHTFRNDQYTVSDLRPRNVLKDPEGNIHVIDDIVRKNARTQTVEAIPTPEAIGVDALPANTNTTQLAAPTIKPVEQSAPKAKRNGFTQSMKRYTTMDAVTPRLAILKYFALGGRVKHNEAIARTGYTSKDLYGWISKKGKSYHDLIQMAREESGRDDFDELDFNNEIDGIISGSKRAVFDELKGYLSEGERLEQDQEFASIDPEGVQADEYYNLLTDEEKLQLYEEQEEAFRGGGQQDVEQADPGNEEQNNAGSKTEGSDQETGRIAQAQLVARADGRTQRQIDTASKRIGATSLKKLVGKLKRSFPNFNVVYDNKGFSEAYQKFKDLGIIKQIIGEEGAKALDVDDILIGKDEAATRLEKLVVAKEMEANGKNAKEIWVTTGWERGKDGKWRMELNYGNWKSANEILTKIKTTGDEKTRNIGKLEDLISAPDLFRAYPDFRQLSVYLVNKANYPEAIYDYGAKEITINVRKFRERFDGASDGDILRETSRLRGLLRVSIHELQHGVQEAEGFARGADPRMSHVRQLAEKLNISPFEAYKRVAGETEARNAQFRAKLTQEERQNLPPSETEDISRIDQIILERTFLQQPTNQQLPSGFVFKDTVYLNPDLVRADTAIHEFGHLWIEVAKNKMQPLYRQGINLVRESSYHQEVIQNQAYSTLTPEQQLDEALAMAIGERGALLTNKKRSFGEWMKDFFDRVKLMLGIKSTLDFQKMTLDDFINVVAKELLTKGEISTLSNLRMPETATFRLKNFTLPQDAYKELVQRQLVDMAIATDPNSWRMTRDGLWRRTFNTMLEGFQDRTRRLKEIQNDIVKYYLDKTVNAIKESSLSKEEKTARLSAIQNKRTALEAALIPASEDPHGLYDLMTGKIQHQTENMRSIFFGKPTGERGYGTLLEHLTQETDFKNLRVKEDTNSVAYQLRQEGLSLYDLGFYAYVLHAKERNAKINEKRAVEGLAPIAGSGMTDQQADQFMNEIHQSGKREVLEKFRKVMQRELVDKPLEMKLNAGLINQETFDLVKNHYRNYTPLVVEELAVGKGEKPIGKLSNGVWGNGIKGIKLGTDLYDYTKRVNPFVQLIFNYEKTVADIERNKMLAGMAKLIKRYPDPNIWNVKSPKYKVDINENGDVEFAEQFRDNDIDKKGIAFMVDGKRRFIVLEDQRLRDLFLRPGRTPTEFEKVVSDLIKNSFSYLRLAFTGLNPSFAFPNFVRDAQDAIVNLSDSEVKGIRSKVFNPKNIANAMKSIWQYEKDGNIKSEYAQAYEEMKANGGQVAWLNYTNAERFYNDTKSEIDNLLRGNTQGKARTLALLPFRSVLRYTLLANKVMEMAIRLSTYKSLRDAGVAPETAALSSKNVTVNFNKHGSYNPILSSLYLFLNAGIQGSARMLTSLARSSQARKLVAGSMAGFVLIRILNQAIDDMEDDEEKKTLQKLNRKDYKENLIINWLQPMGMDKSVIKIPMSYNMRGFKAISDGIYDVAAGNATTAEAMADVVGIYFASLVPISESGAVPTLAQPFVELKDNKRMYNDTPIMPESTFGFKKKDSERYFGTPSILAMELSKALADVNEGRDDVFEISPNQIDYVFDWTTGGLKNWYKTGETALNAARDVNQFDWNKVAIIQRFYTDLEKQEWRDQVLFYDLYNKGVRRKLSEEEFEKLKKYGSTADKKELLKPGVFQRNLQEVIKIQKENYEQSFK